MASPFLMFPIAETGSLEIHSLRFHSLKNKTSNTFLLRENLEEEFQCCGSSHGCLAFSNDRGIVFLLNPITGAHYDLPFIHHHRVIKTILSTSPSHDNNYIVIAMCEVECLTKLVFCRSRDRAWTNLDCKDDKCHDVVWCEETNMVIALASEACVEAWELSKDDDDDDDDVVVLKKIAIVQDVYPMKLIEAGMTFPPDRHSYQSYLALSSGQMFLVVRYIGECVSPEGEVTLDVLNNVDFPYRTVGFIVFKFDVELNKWSELKSLNEFAIFVGGNETMMLSCEVNAELKGNSIYFTDHYWDRMDDDISYGGHDMGIFGIEDGKIEPIMKRQRRRILPPPYWITLPCPQ